MGRLAQAREVQDHEGPVDQDRGGANQHGQPGRARQAPRSLVVIGGAHEAPVSHPLRMKANLCPAAMAGVQRFTLRLNLLERGEVALRTNLKLETTERRSLVDHTAQ